MRKGLKIHGTRLKVFLVFILPCAVRPAPCAVFLLPHSADESFEVGPLGESQRRRMVPGLTEKADDLRISTRVKSRISDNLLEEERRHKPGAGKSEKESSLPEQLESEEVDVLVPSARLRQVAAGFDKSRRVEDDEIELAAGAAVSP